MKPHSFIKSADNFTFTTDWFDFAAGAGYKVFYLAGLDDSASAKYILTSNSSLVADNDNTFITGDSQDIDFDITFNSKVTVAAADAYISYSVLMNGTDADIYTVTWTFRHVDTSGTETVIGSVIDDGSTDGDPSRTVRRSVKTAITKTVFRPGEKLRINVATAITAGTTGSIYIDPSGHVTATDQHTGTISSQASVTIPFEVDF